MQSRYAAHFTREMGCTAAELCQWLQGASRGARIEFSPEGARVQWQAHLLQLSWVPLPERRIALVRLPRLSVTFDFGLTPDAERHAFMKHFDLYTQRGGG